MVASGNLRFCYMVGLAASLVMTMMAGGAQADLQYGYYNTSCPGVEANVTAAVMEILNNDTTLAAGLLRLHFHDCFVRGCDASILLNSVNGTAEKDADPNLTVRGYEAIEAIKAKVEELCPLVVSCADIIAMAARDAVKFSKGPEYEVECGRRDGNVSRKEDALSNLPPADGNVTVLSQFFDAKNLTMKDMVVLSGAHTIGVAHCSSFQSRLYNFSGAGDTDPSMNATYAAELMVDCTATTLASVSPLDTQTMSTFDNGYYKALGMGQGLLISDDELTKDSLTGAYVREMSNDTMQSTYFADFVVSMLKMGRADVLTGTDGEIRKTCRIDV